MKLLLPICTLCLAAISPATAQMAVSHAPAREATMTAPGASEQVTGKTVVRVNGVELTDKELLREMYTIFPYARQHNGFPKAQEAEIRKGAVKMIVFEELVYQESERRKLTISPERLNHGVAQFRKQFSTDAEYQKVLQHDLHGSRDLLRKQIRRSMLIDAFLKREVEDKSAVTLTEARGYYAGHKNQFLVEDALEFQSISILPPDRPNPEQVKEGQRRAEEALRKAKSTGNYREFGLLAEQISEDTFRVNMGNHKSVARSALPPQIVKAAESMKIGDVSNLIQIDGAYTIFRLNAHTVARQKSFGEVSQQIRHDMEQQKAEEIRSRLGKTLRKSAKIEVS